MYVCMYTIIYTEYCITVKIIDINSCKTIEERP